MPVARVGCDRHDRRATVMVMRQPEPSGRHRLAPLPTHTRDRLLRAVDELRALERERQGRRAADRPIDDVTRLVEAKAREIFRLSHDPEGLERSH